MAWPTKRLAHLAQVTGCAVLCLGFTSTPKPDGANGEGSAAAAAPCGPEPSPAGVLADPQGPVVSSTMLAVTRGLSADRPPGALRAALARAAVECARSDTGSARASPTRPPPRPAALIPMYASLAALQALDIDSTLRGLDRGGAEQNPLVSSIASSVMFPVVKGGATAAAIVATERLRRKHPLAAIGVMAGANAVYAVIVARNYAISGR